MPRLKMCTMTYGLFGTGVQALVTDIVPDGKVRAAMNDINASQRLRCAPPPQPR